MINTKETISKSVLFIDNEKHLGGGQIVGLNVIDILAKNKFHIGLMVPEDSLMELELNDTSINPSLHYFSSLDFNEVNYFFTKMLIVCKFFIDNIFKFKKYLMNYDFIYINSIRLLPFLLPCLIVTGKSFGIHIHLIHGPIVRSLVRFVSKFQNCKIIICCSERVYDDYRNHILNDKIVTIRNSLKKDFQDISFVNRFDKTLNIGFIGDISREKGADIVLNLAKKLPDINFFFKGRSKLKQIGPYSENVFLNKNSSNIKEFINSNGINIILMPSRVKESFGLVAIESCALSCITLISSTGYLKNIADECDLKVCTDELMYFEHLIKLSELTSAQLESISKKSWRLVNARYSIEGFTESIKKFLIPLI